MKLHIGGSEDDSIGVEPALLTALRSFYDQLGSHTLQSRKFPLKSLFASTVAQGVCDLVSDRNPSSQEWRELSNVLHLIDLETAMKLHTVTTFSRPLHRSRGPCFGQTLTTLKTSSSLR